jgi:type IV secretory pathway VirB9-like protein
LPKSGSVDPRIRSAVYSADEVYRLYGYVGFHLDLEFEADETFASLSGGDLEASPTARTATSSP